MTVPSCHTSRLGAGIVGPGCKPNSYGRWRAYTASLFALFRLQFLVPIFQSALGEVPSGRVDD